MSCSLVNSYAHNATWVRMKRIGELTSVRIFHHGIDGICEPVFHSFDIYILHLNYLAISLAPISPLSIIDMSLS